MTPYFVSPADTGILVLDSDGASEEMHITVSGDPRPQQCPRSRVIHGRVMVFNPDVRIVERFKTCVRMVLGITEYHPLVFPQGAYVKLDVHVKVRRPPSHYSRGGHLKPNLPLFPTTNGDVDNYDKFVMDGLQGIAYHDDRYVVNLQTSKAWAKGRAGKTKVVVRLVKDNNQNNGAI